MVSDANLSKRTNLHQMFPKSFQIEEEPNNLIYIENCKDNNGEMFSIVFTDIIP